jgi:hypothetical protein
MMLIEKIHATGVPRPCHRRVIKLGYAAVSPHQANSTEEPNMQDNRTEQFFTDLPLIHPMDALPAAMRARLGTRKRWNGDAVWTGDDSDAAAPDDTVLLSPRVFRMPDWAVRLDWNN